MRLWTALKWLLVVVALVGFLTLAGSIVGPVAGLLFACPLLVLAGLIHFATRRDA